MLIVCPKCDTSYRVDRSAFGPDGRRVRCTRCMTTWQASADGAQPIATAMAPTEPAVETTEAVPGAADGSTLAPAPPAVAPVVIAQAPSLVPAIDADAGKPDAAAPIIEPHGEDIETIAAGVRAVGRIPARSGLCAGAYRVSRLSWSGSPLASRP